MIHFGEAMQGGVIVVEPVSDQALVGMDFLKKFRLGLLTDPDIGSVFLFSSDDLKKALAGSKPPATKP